MKITSYCARCLKGTRFDAASSPDAVVCRRCGERRDVTISPLMRDGKVDVCALCECGHLYVEKDFSAWLGLAVILGAVAGFLWAQAFDIVLAFGFLGAAALLDGVMYRLCPLRAICYRCLATYQGARPSAEHKPYDLGVAARFASDFEERRRR